MKEYRIEINGSPIEHCQIYSSAETAWENLKEAACYTYSIRYNMNVDVVKSTKYLILYVEEKRVFQIKSPDNVLRRSYIAPIFAGYYSDKLIYKNLADEIRSIHIEKES